MNLQWKQLPLCQQCQTEGSSLRGTSKFKHEKRNWAAVKFQKQSHCFGSWTKFAFVFVLKYHRQSHISQLLTKWFWSLHCKANGTWQPDGWSREAAGVVLLRMKQRKKLRPANPLIHKILSWSPLPHRDKSSKHRRTQRLLRTEPIQEMRKNSSDKKHMPPNNTHDSRAEMSCNQFSIVSLSSALSR